MRSIWLSVVLASCSKPHPAPARAEPVVSVPVPPSAPTSVEAIPVRDAGHCLSAEQDAEKRRPGAELGEAIDIDGNGAPDPVFRSCHSGNCEYLMYQLLGDCARFLGEVTSASFNDPRCDKPAVDGQPCRLSAMRFMIHGDQQEFFYEFSGGEYVQAGSGRYVAPRKKFP